MNKSALLLGLGAGLLFAAGAANAGICSADIEALQRTIGRINTDANGPYAESYANLDAAIDAEGHTDTGTPGGTVPTPGEIFMPRVNTGQTGDVMASETPPPNSQTARVGRPNRIMGADPDVASRALARAQMLDQAGDPGCTREVTQAKNLLGQR